MATSVTALLWPRAPRRTAASRINGPGKHRTQNFARVRTQKTGLAEGLHARLSMQRRDPPAYTWDAMAHAHPFGWRRRGVLAGLARASLKRCS